MHGDRITWPNVAKFRSSRVVCESEQLKIERVLEIHSGRIVRLAWIQRTIAIGVDDPACGVLGRWQTAHAVMTDGVGSRKIDGRCIVDWMCFDEAAVGRDPGEPVENSARQVRIRDRRSGRERYDCCCLHYVAAEICDSG